MCSTASAPSGCHFEFKDKKDFREVWIVADRDGEVLLQAVFWDSLEALAAAVRHETDCMDAASRMPGLFCDDINVLLFRSNLV